jgi:cytochrome c oxidase assembly protein subunit 11
MTRNRRTGLLLVSVVAAMFGLVAASVPLYRMFCEATGYGGTTRTASAESERTAERVITVRFDGHVNQGLPWRFAPRQRDVAVRLGENTLAFYEATNLAGRDTVGQATFNVLPEKAGPYFYKIQCFCFTEQALKAGQSVEMPVSFYVDPKLAEDPNLADVDTITLSYTFFRADAPRQLSERR